MTWFEQLHTILAEAEGVFDPSVVLENLYVQDQTAQENPNKNHDYHLMSALSSKRSFCSLP